VAIKIKIPKGNGKDGKARFGLPRDPVLRAALIVFLAAAVGLGGAFCYFYIKYDRIIAQRFRSPVFTNSAKIYALPRTVREGDKASAREIAAQLRRAGYSDKEGDSQFGTFHLVSDGIEVAPGPESYHSPEAAHITIKEGQVQSIVSQGNNLSAYELEPQLVTALFDAEQRSKRQVVKYDDIPKVMVEAVLAIEDRRFFEHSGVNFIRMFEAVWIDVIRQRTSRAARRSPCSFRAAFFLTPEKTVKRKLTEMLIAENWNRSSASSRFSSSTPTGSTSGSADRSPSAASPRPQSLLQQRSEGHHPSRGRAAGRIIQGRAGFRRTAIPSARWSAATWCSTRWSRRMPSRASRRIKPRPRR
jgi:penicillin-binding protein 1B